jgi:hypothetical protein
VEHNWARHSTSDFCIPEVKNPWTRDFTSVFGVTEVKFQRGGTLVITLNFSFS